MVVSTSCRWHDGFEYGVEAASGGSTNRGSRPLKEGREVAREALLKKKKKEGSGRIPVPRQKYKAPVETEKAQR